MKWFAGFVVVLLLAAVGAFLGWQALVAAPEGDGEIVTFRVEPGQGLATVAHGLEREGLVTSARGFRLLARLQGQDRGVHAGTYELARGRDPRDLLADLTEGRVRLRRFTVPEGRRLEQIAVDVERQLGVPTNDFLAAVADSARLRRAAPGAKTLEGFLFPETYLFPDGVTAVEVVDAMLDRFDEVWDAESAPVPEGIDRYGLVTLASIIEAETPVEAEKTRVSAVYWNRLRIGMRLQADPTVRYGIGRFDGRLYYKHLDINTPYNTYMHAGLPPGPIGNPGASALRAARSPLDPCDDFYFVASGDGGHVFSRTKREHDRAVAEMRRKRDARS